MCGIGGVWSLTGENAAGAARLHQMMNVILHRGPDSAGTWMSNDGLLHLGHQRLAIQDLSPLGHQPMEAASGRYVLVFNGEIYNFKKLAAELQKLGACFRGHSDTEVMLAAFDAWGVESSLKKFDGMFAFAVYDRELQELWLARDRMGEKPLYISLVGDQLFFCSELKGVLSAVKSKLPIDWAGFGGYFRFGYFGVNETPFADVKKLSPASFVRLTQSGLRNLRDTNALCASSTTYWRRPGVSSMEHDANLYGIDAQDRLEKILTSAVVDQSVADVNVGVFLSGGIDSTLVAALLQKESSRQISTYTIAFDSSAYNEAPFASDIAKYIGTNHVEIPVAEEECLGVIEKLPMLLDEPFADASLIPSYLVCREARKHVTVCLSGDGGDELFGGYNRYRWGSELSAKTQYVPLVMKKLIGSGLLGVPEEHINTLYAFFAHSKLGSGTMSEKDIGSKVHKLGRALGCENRRALYATLLSFWQVSPMARKDCFPALKNCLLGQFGDDPHFAVAAMDCDLDFYLVCDNLFKADRAAMANSLEVRLPFLSKSVVECAARMPVNFKIQGRKSKVILRDVLYRHVPSRLIERPKMGFSVPLASWLRQGLKSWGDSFIGNDDHLVSAGLEPGVVRSAWSEHQSGIKDHANALWVVLMYLQWSAANDEYIKGS